MWFAPKKRKLSPACTKHCKAMGFWPPAQKKSTSRFNRVIYIAVQVSLTFFTYTVSPKISYVTGCFLRLSYCQQSNWKKTTNFMACKKTVTPIYTVTRIPCDRKCMEMMSDHRCTPRSLTYPLKSYQNPIGKGSSSNRNFFQGRTGKLLGGIQICV